MEHHSVEEKKDTVSASSSSSTSSASAASSVEEEKHSFEEMHLKNELLRGIYAYGWQNPSNIQQLGIPAILQERDVIMQARSGVGKTGTFSVAMLQLIDETSPTIQGVIVLNTRELADQVCNVIRDISHYMRVNCIKCVGKTRVVSRLIYEDGPTILVGTPGKICSVLENYIVKQHYEINLLVIDEFDKTLEADFVPIIQDIVHFAASKETKIVLSSATVNEEVLDLTKHFMKEPRIISVKEEELSLDGIRQFHVFCDKEEWKFDTIKDLFQFLVVGQTVIFVNSRRACDYLEDRFRADGFTVDSLHGGMEQTDRDKIMEAFRLSHIRVLLSTDLTARGIDVPSVNLVVNYDLPLECAQYIHRIGRAGRYGKKGCAINLIGRKEMSHLHEIEDHYHITIPELPNNFTDFL